jgi:hypothetical protein
MENLKKQLERKQWVQFKKETQKKVHTRVVLNIERNETIVGQSNFHSWIVTTEKGVANMTLNKSQNPPKIGSIIEFNIAPYSGSYDRFYICNIVKEVKYAGEHYLFELEEIETIKKMNINEL